MSEGSRREAIAGRAVAESLRLLVRTTDITATPIELAICWVMLSNVDP